MHYHQHLRAGENTLNLKLSVELYRWIILRGEYDLDAWLCRYAEVMLTPGWHRDTYAEEYHRNFFTRYARGKALTSCASPDYHIGALSLIPGLLAGLEALDITDPAILIQHAVSFVRATHDHEYSLRAAADFTRILLHANDGTSIRKVLAELPVPGVSVAKFMSWADLPDRVVVGEKLSTACYLPESFVASLYFAWKYHDDFPLPYSRMQKPAVTIATVRWLWVVFSALVVESPEGGSRFVSNGRLTLRPKGFERSQSLKKGKLNIFDFFSLPPPSGNLAGSVFLQDFTGVLFAQDTLSDLEDSVFHCFCPFL